MTTSLAVPEAAAPTRAAPEAGYIGAIDGLRAIAVLSVMVCHLQRNWLPGGFTGVDVFFAISGFVVTLSMMDQRFASVRAMVAFFYARRLRRIAPALIVMLLVATLAGVLFIPNAWLSEVIPSTGLSAFFGLSNVTLAAQTEHYFAPHAEYNTFLHTWSLGVEEQFYLLFPALIALVTVERLRRWRGLAVALLVALSAASLAFCAWQTSRDPVSAFFLLPARFWELGLGMVLALTLPRWRPALGHLSPAVGDGLALAGIAALTLTFAVADEAAFPFPWALAPVFATGLLIAVTAAFERGRAATALSLAPVAYVGRISYSLYLWHWPIYVLLRWTIGLETTATRLGALALTVALAALSYRCVEQPFRRSARLRRLPRVAVVGLGLGALVLGAGFAKAAFALSGVLSLSQTRDAQVWSPYSAPPTDGACRAKVTTRWEAGVKVIDLTPVDCGALEARHLYVAGDSHAGAYMRMLRRLVQRQRLAVSIYASPGCAFLDLLTATADLDGDCPAQNRAMRDALVARVHPGDIVFLPSLRLRRYRDEEGGALGEGTTAVSAAAVDEAARLLAALRARQAQVVLEAPKPVFKSPPFRCADWFDRMNPICAAGFTETRAGFEARRAPVLAAERTLARGPAGITVSTPRHCERSEATQGQRSPAGLLRRCAPRMDGEAEAKVPAPIPSRSGVSIWDPAAVLCDAATCSAWRDGKPLDFDTDHLSGLADDLLLPHFAAHLDEIE